MRYSTSYEEPCLNLRCGNTFVFATANVQPIYNLNCSAARRRLQKRAPFSTLIVGPAMQDRGPNPGHLCGRQRCKLLSHPLGLPAQPCQAREIRSISLVDPPIRISNLDRSSFPHVSCSGSSTRRLDHFLLSCQPRQSGVHTIKSCLCYWRP
jgi:hypothetical protein